MYPSHGSCHTTRPAYKPQPDQHPQWWKHGPLLHCLGYIIALPSSTTHLQSSWYGNTETSTPNMKTLQPPSTSRLNISSAAPSPLFLYIIISKPNCFLTTAAATMRSWNLILCICLNSKEESVARPASHWYLHLSVSP